MLNERIYVWVDRYQGQITGDRIELSALVAPVLAALPLLAISAGRVNLAEQSPRPVAARTHTFTSNGTFTY